MQDHDLTPMMRQYYAVKQETADALLLFRLGDFYELFFDDAITASRELEITLTARNKDRDKPVPMCGVPYHAAEDRKSTRLNSSHSQISYAVFCLKKKKNVTKYITLRPHITRTVREA